MALVKLTALKENGIVLPKPKAFVVETANTDFIPGATITKVKVYDKINTTLVRKTLEVVEKVDFIHALKLLAENLAAALPAKNFLESAIAAAGANQGAAYAIIEPYSEVATATATSAEGVRLPAATVGLVRHIQNSTTVTVKVYPATGETVDGGAANAAQDLLTKRYAIYYCAVAGTWTKAVDLN
jgi:hypothetical protein